MTLLDQIRTHESEPSIIYIQFYSWKCKNTGLKRNCGSSRVQGWWLSWLDVFILAYIMNQHVSHDGKIKRKCLFKNCLQLTGSFLLFLYRKCSSDTWTYYLLLAIIGLITKFYLENVLGPCKLFLFAKQIQITLLTPKNQYSNEFSFLGRMFLQQQQKICIVAT